MIVVVVHITHIQNTSKHWETKKVMKALDNAQEGTLQHKGVSTLDILFLSWSGENDKVEIVILTWVWTYIHI